MKKILLMGSEGAGKTSMHSVIFANLTSKGTSKLGYTIERKEHKLKFMGNLTFNLWDCGGQDTFMDNYFMVQRETIFKNVQVVIYVFDVDESPEKLKKSLGYWQRAVNCVEQFNENGSVFVLLHKIDKLPPSERQNILNKKTLEITEMIKDNKVKVKEFFSTSIWDETLYQAWSRIVQELIPNRGQIQQCLQKLVMASNCQEACLFQRTTFLTLGHYNVKEVKDILRYEKISNIIKQFRLTCMKSARNIKEIGMNSNGFNVMIAEFTASENILVVFRDIQCANTARLNIEIMGKIFEVGKNKATSS